MGRDSSIEWTTHTFNPWWGCTKVSEACKNCYAEAWARRTGSEVWGPQAARRFFGDKHWREPLAWNEAMAGAARARVFCASMADVFEKRPELDGERFRLWNLIEATPNLDWLLLTKRPENIATMLPAGWLEKPRPNIWLGTTIELQGLAEKRLDALLAVPAVVHFVSCEPLLSALDLAPWLRPEGKRARIDWVIAGGESGHGARPTPSSWFESLRDQCSAAGAAFLFKQWGEWRTDGESPVRLGKKKAGRDLHGRTWDMLPLISPSSSTRPPV